MYWRPVVGFISREGYSAPEAQDLAQEFFLAVLEGKLLNSATPSRGRFRSLLLMSLKNFLIDAKIKAGRRKRGGDAVFVALQDWDSDMPASCSPETLFDVRWAVTIAEEAVRRLREECESKGRRNLYEVLSQYLDADRKEISYRAISAQLGISEKTVKNLIHEFRKRFRSLLREEVGKTVQNPAEVEDEIRYLCGALASLPL
ncbi:MAG: polymerase sigma factor, sigma-70 family [Spartobacteria bacterium]|nr:polymerase sigma factor, sigma-70 family [Spartobacteria bacterium]